MTTDALPVDKLVKIYRKISDKRAEIKATFEEADKALEADMNKIKDALMEHCKANNVDSVKTEHGTVVRTKKRKFWTSDWDAFGNFILEHQAPQLLAKTINQSNMEEFLAEHPDVKVPFLQKETSYQLVVRKPTARRT